MNSSVKASLLTLAISAAFAPGAGSAAPVTQTIAATAMARCQSFTPGPANTIKNRVVGSENIGNTLAIACAFEVDAAAITGEGVTNVTLFLNNTSAASFSVPCTLATGFDGEFSYFINKTTTVSPATATAVEFDNGVTGFGEYLVGLTCSLPKNGMVQDTYVTYTIDNGV